MTCALINVYYCDRPTCYRVILMRDFSIGSAPSQSYYNIDIEEYKV